MRIRQRAALTYFTSVLNHVYAGSFLYSFTLSLLFARSDYQQTLQWGLCSSLNSPKALTGAQSELDDDVGRGRLVISEGPEHRQTGLHPGPGPGCRQRDAQALRGMRVS